MRPCRAQDIDKEAISLPVGATSISFHKALFLCSGTLTMCPDTTPVSSVFCSGACRLW